MNETIDNILRCLHNQGNLRTIPSTDTPDSVIDLSSNDYLGIAADSKLREDFLAREEITKLSLSASASRLLAARQTTFSRFEKLLEQVYGSPALLFNSGYHANSGIVGALGSLRNTYILADKLVHASIIDGIKLSGAPFGRFRHNDYQHLGKLAAKAATEYENIIIIAESIYSMDGDKSDIDALAEVKRSLPSAILYIDEAHAVGVEGPGGLGIVAASVRRNDVDIIIGTLGKALGSTGSYAIVNNKMRSFLVNKARSLIFSTALPPFNIAWSEFAFRAMLGMDSQREKLHALGLRLAQILAPFGGSQRGGHIQPLIAGTPVKAVEWSKALAEDYFSVLPVRTPTVPPGTDRLRFSLSARIDPEDISKLSGSLTKIINNGR